MQIDGKLTRFEKWLLIYEIPLMRRYPITPFNLNFNAKNYQNETEIFLRAREFR